MKVINEVIASIFKSIYEYTNDFGWSIILFSVIFKLVLYPFTAKQNKLMEKFKEIQPQMKELQEKYKDKSQDELNRKIMELYTKHKLNPLSGCFPIILMLIQIPILFGILAILREPEKFLGIKEASFYGLNLMTMDYNGFKLILPFLSGVTTYWQQKLMMTGGNTPQNKMMLVFFPFMIGFFTLKFPAGLALYWVTTNILTVGQLYLTKAGTNLQSDKKVK